MIATTLPVPMTPLLPQPELELSEGAKRIINRTQEEILADRAEIMKTARMGRPLPEGKTLADVIEGQWPGDETDEQINEALERLS